MLEAHQAKLFYFTFASMWNERVWIITGGAFLTSLAIAWALMPFVIRYANKRQLFDIPDGRKLHDDNISRIGGIAIMISVILGISVFIKPQELPSYSYLIAGMVIMFFVGLLDDMYPIKPAQKLLGEVIPAALIVVMGGQKIQHLNGLFGIYALPEWLALVSSFLLVLAVINSFNLVDGINGLAGICGLIAATACGVIALINDSTGLAVIAFSLAGGIVAFMRFNLLNPRIFMGDSGSLLIGFLISFLMLSVINLAPATNETAQQALIHERMLLLVISAVIVPLADLLRVFVIRVIKGKSPFSADRNHIHHLLLDLGCSHLAASLILGLFTLLFILLFIVSMEIEYSTQFFLLLAVGFICSSLPWLALYLRKNTQSKSITL